MALKLVDQFQTVCRALKVYSYKAVHIESFGGQKEGWSEPPLLMRLGLHGKVRALDTQ